jgi:hypothetical protein
MTSINLPKRTEISLLKLIDLSPEYFLQKDIREEIGLVKLNCAYLSLIKFDMSTELIEAHSGRNGIFNTIHLFINMTT